MIVQLFVHYVVTILCLECFMFCESSAFLKYAGHLPDFSLDHTNAIIAPSFSF